MDVLQVAVKTIKSADMSEDFLREASIMKEVRHPNLVTLYGVCTVGEPVLIVTEYMCNGSLLDYLQSAAGYALGTAQVCAFVI